VNITSNDTSGNGSARTVPDQVDPQGKEINWRQQISEGIVAVIAAVVAGYLSASIRHVPIVLALCAVVLVSLALVLRYLGRNATVARWILLVIGATVIVIGAAVIGAVIRPAGAKPHGASSSPGITPSSLNIKSPTSVIDCTSSALQCQFPVSGHATPEPASDLEILVLVYPTSPSGQGWYIQLPPASIRIGGDWSQIPSLIGSSSSTAPARNGDTLQIEAVLVRSGATYDGSTLADISKSGKAIADVRQITGLVAQSQIVQLTVIKR
jgi:hypothetical protein